MDYTTVMADHTVCVFCANGEACEHNPEAFVADCGQVFDNAVDKYIHAEDCVICYGI